VQDVAELLPLPVESHAAPEREVIEEVPIEQTPDAEAVDHLAVVAIELVPQADVGFRDDVEVLVQVEAAELPADRLALELTRELELFVGLPGLVLVELLEEQIRSEV